MWNWIKRVFGNTTNLLVVAATAVAKQRLEESLYHTDKFDDVQKQLIRELIDAFIADLMVEVNK